MFLRFFLFATLVASAAIAESEVLKRGQRRGLEGKTTIDINGTEYMFSDEPLEWYEARTDCIERGMQLISLETKEKSEFFIEYLKNNSFYDTWTWTSGRRDIGEPNFIWTSINAPFVETETSWIQGEPNNNDDYPDCMSFAGSRGGWADNNCGYFILYYICEPLA